LHLLFLLMSALSIFGLFFTVFRLGIARLESINRFNSMRARWAPWMPHEVGIYSDEILLNFSNKEHGIKPMLKSFLGFEPFLFSIYILA